MRLIDVVAAAVMVELGKLATKAAHQVGPDSRLLKEPLALCFWVTRGNLRRHLAGEVFSVAGVLFEECNNLGLLVGAELAKGDRRNDLVTVSVPRQRGRNEQHQRQR